MSTPISSNTIGLTLDNPIDFVFSPRLITGTKLSGAASLLVEDALSY